MDCGKKTPPKTTNLILLSETPSDTRTSHLPIAIVVGADLLRIELDPVGEATRGLQLKRLRNNVHDVAELLRRAIMARSEQEWRLLEAMAVCSPEGFWFPLTVQIAGLSEAQGARRGTG